MIAELGEKGGIAGRDLGQLRAQCPGRDGDGDRGRDNGDDDATAERVPGQQATGHEKRGPAVGGVAVHAVGLEQHEPGDDEQHRGDERLPRPALGEGLAVTNPKRSGRASADHDVEDHEDRHGQQQAAGRGDAGRLDEQGEPGDKRGGGRTGSPRQVPARVQGGPGGWRGGVQASEHREVPSYAGA